MIGHAHRAHIADAAQSHHSLTILGRLLRVSVVQFALGPRDGAEILLHQIQRFGLLETAGDDQHNIIGLVKLFVESAQVFNRHPLDIAAIANRGFAIVVPFVRRGGDALAQNAASGIFASFKFIAHNGHFRFEVLAFDITINQAVGFQADGEFEVLVVGGQRFKVIDPIIRSAAIELRAMFLQLLGDFRVLGRAFKNHVFQQVGHSRFAIAFMARADQDGHVDGHFGLGIIGEEQDAQSVLEMVFGDAFDGRNLCRRCGGQRLM